MEWNIIFSDEFELEFDQLSEIVQDECLAHLEFLKQWRAYLRSPSC
jgi:hypothetical protein